MSNLTIETPEKVVKYIPPRTYSTHVFSASFVGFEPMNDYWVALYLFGYWKGDL